MSDRSVTILIVAVVGLGLLWAILTKKESPSRLASNVTALAPEMVPLVTGEESIGAIFTRAGCPVCHIIPGIAGAEGRVGPPLVLGSTGADRLRDPSYHGQARTVHEYVVESVIEPGVFVVPGYPAATMPTWYGAKLSALALEKIASYLEGQTTEAGSSIK
jgi:hypothetical protein